MVGSTVDIYVVEGEGVKLVVNTHCRNESPEGIIAAVQPAFLVIAFNVVEVQGFHVDINDSFAVDVVLV
jgi:hypothetical protein